ncbi:MAG: NAD(P)H-dependent oxidoreductase subunit E [Bacillota bacterium]|nr:NAD(P)H-dependent oxidoreductase subunit E [Bacillota bacterium]
MREGHPEVVAEAQLWMVSRRISGGKLKGLLNLAFSLTLTFSQCYNFFMEKEKSIFDETISKHNHDISNLIMMLQDIQSATGYISSNSVEYLSRKLNIPEAQIYSVATFYKSFSLRPKGKHRVDICEGTACHIRGASVLMSRASDELGIKAGETTADGEFSLNSVHCVGACAMGPVVVIDGKYHGSVTTSTLSKELRKSKTAADGELESTAVEEVPDIGLEKINSPQNFKTLQELARSMNALKEKRVLVCAGTGCIAKGSLEVAGSFKEALGELNLEIPVSLEMKTVGCQGFCEKGPLVIIIPDEVFYSGVKPGDVKEIVNETLLNNRYVEKLLYHEPNSGTIISRYEEIPFFAGQHRIALRNVGTINPLNIYDYLARGGYSALLNALYFMNSNEIITEVENSGLRGRGGGGFSTGKKWRTTAKIESPVRYVICNGDEGDPGAFMDRSIMEGDPHSVIEGMVICAYAVGSNHGYIYVREEYPRALKHLEEAIDQARRAGFLGNNICGTDFSFDIRINRGTGAFVCGESTALMQSVEGKVGEPRAKYIRSAERGLYDQPTVLNNVETFVNIPPIIENGAAWFASTGTEKSPGTKVFSVVGKVKNTGLVEVPMGMTLRSIIYDVCGGILNNKKFKAVQTGGPSGGCLPESKLDLPVDFDTLTREGSMMGSGGMIVMDEDTCMVDVARYFTDFLNQESCGKCSACRLGISNLHSILDRICRGEGVADDIERIEKLLSVLELGSLCGLGKSAPNPVRSTLTHFKNEYMAHIIEKRCPAGVCRALISYEINDLCTGCRRCARNCPQNAISGEKNERHYIDQELCNRCGLCLATCNFEAVFVKK